MKKLLIILSLFFLALPAVAKKFDAIKLNVEENRTNPIVIKSSAEQLKEAKEKGSTLYGSIEMIVKAQREADVEDIKNLWDSTVERNKVIGFAIKKIATPPEYGKKNSSAMAKTVSSLISGASLLPKIFGADSLTSTASTVTARLANQAVYDKMMPEAPTITDTELIQLADVVDDLQDKIIKEYYDYKSSLEGLMKCNRDMVITHKNYSEALEQESDIKIILLSSQYDENIRNEALLKNKIKLHKLQLERIAGKEIVDNLSLASQEKAFYSYDTAQLTDSQK